MSGGVSGSVSQGVSLHVPSFLVFLGVVVAGLIAAWVVGALLTFLLLSDEAPGWAGEWLYVFPVIACVGAWWLCWQGVS